MVPLKSFVLCSLLLIWGYKDAQCKSPVKLLYEESDDNDDRGSDEKQYTFRKVADNNIDVTDIWNSEGDLSVEYDGTHRLFKEDNKTSEAISETFKHLFGFYNKNRGKVDPCVKKEKTRCGTAQNKFLDHILNEEPIKKLGKRIRGHLRRLQITDLKEYLKKIWFTAYTKSRGDKLDSSGFEHVFLGEIDESDHVTGLHNWMRMYVEEADRKFELRGTPEYYPLPISESIAARVGFKWYGKDKDASTFFMKTSPAMEIALYTLCFAQQPDKMCSLNLGKATAIMLVKPIRVGDKDVISSAIVYSIVKKPEDLGLLS